MGIILKAIATIILLLIGPVGWFILMTYIWVSVKVNNGLEMTDQDIELEKIKERLAKLETANGSMTMSDTWKTRYVTPQPFNIQGKDV